MLDQASAVTPLPHAEARVQSGYRNPDYSGRRLWSAEQAGADAGPHGFVAASVTQLPKAHAFCEALMQMQLAPLWALASAHMHSRGAAWVHHEEDALTGVFLFLPLSWDGEASLRAGRFSYAAPRLDDLCQPGDEISAIYLWFAGGATQDARRAIMRTTASWIGGALSGLRIYGRAASEEGARGLAKFGFRRLAPERSDLFILSEDRGRAA